MICGKRTFVAKSPASGRAGVVLVTSGSNSIAFYWEFATPGLCVDFPDVEDWIEYCSGKPMSAVQDYYASTRETREFGWAIPYYQEIKQAIVACADFHFKKVKAIRGGIEFSG